MRYIFLLYAVFFGKFFDIIILLIKRSYIILVMTDLLAHLLKVFRSRKLGLEEKYIISLSRIAILLSKGLFKREKIIFYKKI